MSLKVFHIVFIACSCLLTLGFAFWAYSNYQQANDRNYLVTALGSLAFTVGLIVYGILFWQKIKKIDHAN